MFKKDGFVIIKGFLDKNITQEISISLENLLISNQEQAIERIDQELFLVWSNVANGKSKKFNLDLLPQIRSNILTKKNIDFLKFQASTNFLQLFETVFFIKPALIGQGFPLHNDNCFFPLYPADHFSLWIAISESTKENGCLKLRKGSHKDKIVLDLDIKRSGAILEKEEIFLAHASKFESIDIPLNPGDAVIFDGYCFHESDPNTTSQDRVALSMRFLKQPSSLLKNRSKFKSAEFVRQIEYCDNKMSADIFPIF